MDFSFRTASHFRLFISVLFCFVSFRFIFRIFRLVLNKRVRESIVLGNRIKLFNALLMWIIKGVHVAVLLPSPVAIAVAAVVVIAFFRWTFFAFVFCWLFCFGRASLRIHVVPLIKYKKPVCIWDDLIQRSSKHSRTIIINNNSNNNNNTKNEVQNLVRNGKWIITTTFEYMSSSTAPSSSSLTHDDDHHYRIKLNWCVLALFLCVIQINRLRGVGNALSLSHRVS